MSYTLEDFATDCRNALRADPGQSGQEKVLDFVRKALLTKNSSPPTCRLPCPKIATSFIGMKNSVF